MKHTYRIPLFQAMEADAVERYLKRMAARGLQLESAGTFLWKFRRTKPAALTYAVTYFPEASAYGGPMTPEQQELADYCSAAGWTYVTQWQRMQIYVTDWPEPVPLETDEALKLELIDAVFRKNLPYELLFLAALSLQILLQIHNISQALSRFPTQFLSSSNLIPIAAFLLLAVLITFLMATELLRMKCWLLRAKRCLERGYSCPPSSRRLFQVLWAGINMVLLLFLALILLRLLFSGSPAQTLKLLVFFGILMLIRLLVIPYLQKKGYQDHQIFKRLLAACLSIGLVFILIANAAQPKFQEIPPAWYYVSEESGIRYGIYEDPMSLTLEDLGVDPGDLPYSRFSRNNSRSFLLSREEGEEDCPAEEEFPGEQPDLSYERLHVFYSPIYEICRGALLHQEMELISDPRWQANSVYSGTDWDGTPTLLICWEKDILLLTSNLVPNLSDQQIQIIAQWATA